MSSTPNDASARPRRSSPKAFGAISTEELAFGKKTTPFDLGVDGRPGSALMLPAARAWASMLGMGLTVVTVSEPAPPPLRPEYAQRLYAPQGDADTYIEKLVASLDGPDMAVTGKVIWDPLGPAAALRTLLAHNAEGASGSKGLLAISSHSQTPPTPGVPLGRAALHIVHESPVPVLIIPLPAEDHNSR